MKNLKIVNVIQVFLAIIFFILLFLWESDILSLITASVYLLTLIAEWNIRKKERLSMKYMKIEIAIFGAIMAFILIFAYTVLGTSASI